MEVAENQLELSSCVVTYASVPDTVEFVEQTWEQQESITDDRVTTATQELPISEEREDNVNHEQDKRCQRVDEDSQCNVYWPAITRVVESDEEQALLTAVIHKDDACAGA